MSRRICFVVLLALPVFLALQQVGALEADEPVGAPAGGSLLERLSAETIALAERGASASAHLVSEQGVWVGVLVGEPARFVMALDPGAVVADLPRVAKLRQVGQGEADATLLDADADLGLAIYEPKGTPRSGLAPGGAKALVRGALAVVGDAARPALVTLGTSSGPLEDLPLVQDVGGVALLAPGGALLGLAPSSSQANLATCTTCHQGVSAHYEGKLFLSTDGGQTWGATPTSPRLTELTDWRSSVTAGGAGRSIYAPYLHALTAYRGHGQDADGLWAAHAQAGWASVPGPVIARALEDVKLGRRLGRGYLGVVPEGARADAIIVGSAQKSFLLPRVADPNQVSRFFYPVEADAASREALLSHPPAGFVRLSQVIADSPAAKAGLRGAQDILALDGVEVRGATHFARMLARRRPGETVTLSVRGLADPVRVVLGDRDKEGRALATALSVGLEVQALTAELSAFLGVQAGEGGVVVRAVTPEGAAAQAGLQRGDVIRDGGGGPIRDLAELDAVLGAAREGVLLGIERQGQRFAVTLNPPKTGAGLLPR